ncbi:GNAT family N-acetyltransferase [Arthrobacter sp. B6]|uniref:GNAT family N-acetyltransferase n=1 Tax=Arthrobacter sp. B6 TaxID=1570137 RepID=UPI001E3F687B|nr:GNAT family N-acetyltransferase [Arthrobacter sp. B6]
MSVREDVEHGAEHAQVWAAETAGAVMAAVTLTLAGRPTRRSPGSGSWSSGCFPRIMICQGGGVGRAVVLEIVELARHQGYLHHECNLHGTGPPAYQSLGFRRAPERDWYVPGEDIPPWVFTLQLVEAKALPAAR